MYETSVGVIIFRISKRVEFLLLQRTNNDMWDFPKGHYNSDSETEMCAALRELEEETRITKASLFNDFRYEYDFINPKGSHRRIILFLGEAKEDPILSDEHKEYKWVNYEEACKLLIYKEKITLITSAKEHLIKHHYTV